MNNQPFFLPWRVINSISRILNTQGALKHGDEWKTRADCIDFDAAERHWVKYMDPNHNDLDLETGEPHEVHRIARLMLAAERHMIEAEDGKSPSPTRIESMSIEAVESGE